MIRDLFVPVAELLFWFTGGEMLLNTVWFFVWVVGGAVVMVLVSFVAAEVWFGIELSKRGNSLKWIPHTLFLVLFFPVLLLIASPVIIQGQMMEECLPIQTQTVNTELVNDVEVRIRHCRFKANFYDAEFGEWKTWAVDRHQ